MTAPVCGACRNAWGRCACAAVLDGASGSQLERFAALFRLLGPGVDPQRAAREAARLLGLAVRT